MAARKNPPTAQQWGEHREEIEKLYIGEDLPLRNVMKKLAQKGFEPTSSQYRSRFKIWKLKKPRKPRKTSKIDGGEVTAQSPAVSESGYMRDEFWQFEIDHQSYLETLEKIERDLGG